MGSKVDVQEKGPGDINKHKCPNCYSCQMCNDDKCKLCLTPQTRRVNEGYKFPVELFDRQISFLYDLSNAIRLKTGSMVKRVEIIRALIDALKESGIDLTTATSEDELKAMLVGVMKR